MRFFAISRGTRPLLLSCPHGGFKKPKKIPGKTKGTLIPDRNTYFVARQIIHSLNQEKIDLFYILSKIHRSKIDFNRPPRTAVAFNQSSNLAREIHERYHEYLKEFATESKRQHARCLLIDFHGFTKPFPEYPDIILGSIFGKTLTIKNSDEYWGFSQICRDLSKKFDLDDGLGITDHNLGYSGGYITHLFHKTPQVNAFQLEISKNIRFNPPLRDLFVETLVKSIKSILE